MNAFERLTTTCIKGWIEHSGYLERRIEAGNIAAWTLAKEAVKNNWEFFGGKSGKEVTLEGIKALLAAEARKIELHAMASITGLERGKYNKALEDTVPFWALNELPMRKAVAQDIRDNVRAARQMVNLKEPGGILEAIIFIGKRRTEFTRDENLPFYERLRRADACFYAANLLEARLNNHP